MRRVENYSKSWVESVLSTRQWYPEILAPTWNHAELHDLEPHGKPSRNCLWNYCLCPVPPRAATVWELLWSPKWTPDFAELAYPGISWQSKLNPEPSGTAQCIFNLCQFFSVPDSFGSFGCSSFGSHTWTRRQGRDQHLTAVVQKISKHVQRHKDHVSWWAHLCWWSADYQIHINSKENWMKNELYVYI
jgi:hypothetical protein